MKKATDNLYSEMNRVLLEGAKGLVKDFKSPGDLLLDLIRAQDKIHTHVRDAKLDHTKDHYYFLVLISQDILYPWLKKDKDYITIIARGIKGLHSYQGFEGCQGSVQAILQAYGHDDGGLESSEQVMYDIEWFLKLSKIVAVVEEYEKLDDIRRQQEKVEA